MKYLQHTRKLLLVVMVLALLSHCTKQDEPLPVTLPTITTSPVTSITKFAAVSGGTVTSNGNGTITEQGIVWSTSSGVTDSSPFKALAAVGSSLPDKFTSNIPSLAAGTTYFVRAFATNSAGTAYGQELSFVTGALEAATVTTSAATEVQFFAARVDGVVTSAGDGPVSERGFVFKTSAGPTVADSKVTAGTGTGAFFAYLTGLTPSTKYYVRSFATTVVGTSYGAEINFTTTAGADLAANLDGTNDYIRMNDNAAFDLTTNYTLEAWIKLDSYKSLGGIISKYQSLGANGYTLRLSSAAPYDEINFDGMVTQNLNLVLGKWYHVAAVKSGATRSLYINGSKVPLTGTPDFTNASANSDFLGIGVDYTDRYFDGTIDEVRIWNIARTQAQIDAAWDVVLTGTETGLVGYYRMFADAAASASNTGKTLVVDFSKTKVHGTMVNFTLSGGSSNWLANYTKPVLTLGQAYLGGAIAYIDASGHHGFIVTTSDQYSGSTIAWSTILGNIGTQPGLTAGASNTSMIVNFVGSSTTYAARVCQDLVLNSYDDWYLPSKDQLEKMEDMDHLIGNLTGWYWSSTESSSTSAYDHYFPNGSLSTTYSKSNGVDDKVRAVRSF